MKSLSSQVCSGNWRAPGRLLARVDTDMRANGHGNTARSDALRMCRTIFTPKHDLRRRLCMPNGTVKWFNNRNDFGFITPEDAAWERLSNLPPSLLDSGLARFDQDRCEPSCLCPSTIVLSSPGGSRESQMATSQFLATSFGVRLVSMSGRTRRSTIVSRSAWACVRTRREHADQLPTLQSRSFKAQTSGLII